MISGSSGSKMSPEGQDCGSELGRGGSDIDVSDVLYNDAFGGMTVDNSTARIWLII
jgi:hypothetical protein